MVEDNKDLKIRELKPGYKVKEVGQPEIYYDFTCQRCGAHSYSITSASHHKFGGGNILPSSVRVCRNCGNGEQISD